MNCEPSNFDPAFTRFHFSDAPGVKTEINVEMTPGNFFKFSVFVEELLDCICNIISETCAIN